MEPHLCVGIDVGCKAHRIGIAHPDGSILEEFDISHSDVGFREFFHYDVQALCSGTPKPWPNKPSSSGSEEGQQEVVACGEWEKDSEW